MSAEPERDDGSAVRQAKHQYLRELRELQELAKSAPYVTDDWVQQVACMDEMDMRRRLIRSADWHGHFAHCLDGIPEIFAMPGAGIDGCRSHKEVRAIVLGLLDRIATLDAAVAAARAEERALTKEQIDYPREVFGALIDGNSPYAFYLFQWVPYQTDAQRWRLKMKHDVRTFDGREAHGIWPNGSHCGPFRDDEVEFIRISRRQWGEEWADPRPPRGAAATRDLKPEGE